MNDIKVDYHPFKEIVIMDYVRFGKVDDLVRFANVTAGGKTVGLYWVDGVVFVYYPLPAREVVARSIIEEKKVYWTFVGFAVMPKYQPIVETREKIIAPVIDMSGSSMFQRVAEWLKQQK
ncbi:MAG: hypothetical protein ACE5NN_03605 [Candidatus Bathyarchaeia archaeon]